VGLREGGCLAAAGAAADAGLRRCCIGLHCSAATGDLGAVAVAVGIQSNSNSNLNSGVSHAESKQLDGFFLGRGGEGNGSWGIWLFCLLLMDPFLFA